MTAREMHDLYMQLHNDPQWARDEMFARRFAVQVRDSNSRSPHTLFIPEPDRSRYLSELTSPTFTYETLTIETPNFVFTSHDESLLVLEAATRQALKEYRAR